MGDVCHCPEGPVAPRARCRRDGDTLDDPWTEAEEAEDRRRIARHEAAHAIIALSLGRHVEYVTTIEDDPHAMHRGRADGPRWLHDAVLVLMAGRLGEGELQPLDHRDCRARIAASRTRCLGECDECKVAFFLGALWGRDRTDDELAQFWGHLRAVVLNLLNHPVIVEAIDRVAAALGRRSLLLADDLEILTNVTALRAVAAELLSQREDL